MSKRQTVISPISIDLGAKYTGVYFAHYPAGSCIHSIEKMGRVYQLEKDDYTLMMTNRTAARHQRRGYKRKNMVKRLFRLIWCQELGLEWDDSIQQTISLLLNRRGFNYLTDEFDAKILDDFPEVAFRELPKIIRNEIRHHTKVNESLFEWKQLGSNHIMQFLNKINKKSEKTKRRLGVISSANELKIYCDFRIEGKKVEENKRRNSKFSKLSKWIVESWESDGIKGLEAIEENANSINLILYLDQIELETVTTILDSIPITEYESERKELNSSIWKFEAEKFELEKADFDKHFVRSHIHHFAFALYKINDELTSGVRYRGKYFEEIDHVLKRENHTHRYLAEFCNKLQAGEFKPRNRTCLNIEKLSRLIGHLSNLELKPLRKYFDDVQHKNGDVWDGERLSELFGRWILKDWRVDKAKDLDKAEGEKGDYRRLRYRWKSHGSGVVDFWLQEDPYLTIPPYQNNNNRRPPRCQSLILNPDFLDTKYECWQQWVSQLTSLTDVKEYLSDYQIDLESLKSGKGRRYFSDDELTGNRKIDAGRRTPKDLDARVLQFILDRVKATDPLNLNEIFSHVKKIRQSQSTQEEIKITKRKLEDSIHYSKLPDDLKTERLYQNDEVFSQGSFLHLVYNYYKNRQKARDGRLFVHPEYRYVENRGYKRTGRFESRTHLLTYCNYIPRQMHHQMVENLAALFSLSPQQLKERTNSTSDADLLQWLNGIDGLESYCDKASKAQKVRRGRLKEDIRALNKDTGSGLSKLTEKSNSLCSKLYDQLNCSDRNRSSRDPTTAVFLLAQIHTIVFNARGGKSKTCAVCCLDNARRMQFNLESVHAQRLPAIPTRVIDGAVMRMARITSHAIAIDKWEMIEDNLKEDMAVRVPIITESNRFEFEPNLNVLKGRKPKVNGKQVRSKKDRIMAAGNKISPYSGETVGNDGDLDHIIPRSHPEWGTLNDEANRIYTSKQDNREVKGNRIYTISDLHDNYKNSVFSTTDSSEIAKWIISTIWDEDKEDFKFGRFFSFIDLDHNQQKAFRHALFLEHGNPLRDAVISAINHRTKTFVNGTQRYFTEALANELYKKAKAINRHHLLSFDYFGVEALDNSRGDGIYNLRKDLVGTYRQDLNEFSKQDDVSQKAYSHLLDAQIGFCMIADSHQGDGGLRIDLADTGIWSRVNRSTGEILSKNNKINGSELFDTIQVKPDQMKLVNLKREPFQLNKFAHRMIHRDTLYAEHYLPILVDRETAKIRIGFDWHNSFAFNENNANRQFLYFALKFNPKTKDLNLKKDDSFKDLVDRLDQIGFGKKGGTKFFCISLNKQMVHQFYIKNFNTANGFGNRNSGEFKFLRDKLAYCTERERITTLNKAILILNNDSKFRLNKGKQHGVVLPVKEEWKKLVAKWKIKSESIGDNDFLKSYFIKNSDDKPSHEKFRKDFSLPVKTSGGKMLIKRKSWNDSFVFQIVNDSDPSGAKPFIPIFAEGKLTKLLTDWAKSNNVFLLKQEKDYYSGKSGDIRLIDKDKWYAVNLTENEREQGIDSLEYKISDNTRPFVRVLFNESRNEDDICELLKSPSLRLLLAPRDPNSENAKQKFLEELQGKLNQGKPLEYKGDGFNQAIKKKLSETL